MNRNKKTFKDDIEAAERKLLVASWIGVAFSMGIIMYAFVAI